MSPSRRPLTLLLVLLGLVALPMVGSAQTGLPVFNVKTYGATGDGTTDDTTAILAAFTAAGDNSIVYFPAGTYSTGFIDLLGLDGVTIRGQGRASLLQRRPGGTNTEPIIRIGASTDVVVEYLAVDLNNCLSFCSGIELDDVPRFRVQYNYVFDSNINTSNFNDKFGITIQGSPTLDEPGYILYNILEDVQLEMDRRSNVLIQGNKVIRPRFTAGIGFFTNTSVVSSARNVSIVDNVIQDADVSCASICVIFDPPNQANFTYSDFIIARNVVLYTVDGTATAERQGIKVGSGNNTTNAPGSTFANFQIVDNYIWAHPTAYALASLTGIFLSSSPAAGYVFHRFVVRGNTIVLPTAPASGIDMRMMEDSVISHNVVHNVQASSAGIGLLRAKRVQIHDNRVSGAGGIGFNWAVNVAYDVDVHTWGNVASQVTTPFILQDEPTIEYWLEDFPLTAAAAQVISAPTTTIVTWGLNMGVTLSADMTMTSTPTLNPGRDGQQIRLINMSAPLLTIQDERTLTGTRLFLQTPAVTLAQYQTVTLRYFLALNAWLQDASPTSAGQLTIASGTAALGTTAISAGTCAAAVTAAATGTLTTDVVTAGFAGDPTAIAGYLPTPAGMLTILSYPTANTVNFKVCNNTGASITPGAVTLNWSVAR